MKRLFAVTALVLLTGQMSLAAIYIPPTPTSPFVDPAWERFTEGTTFQWWTFGTPLVSSMSTVLPDYYHNPNGTPSALVLASQYGVNNDIWFDEWGGHFGVVPLSGSVIADIPNYETDNPYKDILIQFIWAADEPADPGEEEETPCVTVEIDGVYYTVDPASDLLLGLTGEPGAGVYWHFSTYLLEVEPNPYEEKITVSGNILIDELAIDTICFPEPTTIVLLTAGSAGLLLRRWRK
ncbi:MAG: PEP-CTERM sorting domain-containing protein [Phycisphaerae bacterium]|nr:PEP-CTERM sorting domain-containing protein [Phycisphaerae bacterium]